MRKLIDIAARTGQPPVRALLSQAVGSSDQAVLQPHEIRYRNDQHHVIYGLYEDETILGLIGLARDPATDTVRVEHLAVADEDEATVVELLRTALSRQRQSHRVWNSPGPWSSLAAGLGLTEVGDGVEDSR